MRISGLDKVDKLDHLVKENVTSKNSRIENVGTLEHCRNQVYKSQAGIEGEKNLGQKYRKYFQ